MCYYQKAVCYKHQDTDDQFEEKNFKDKIKEVFNFPPYPNHKNGKYLLINIREYLIKKKHNNKINLYPNYINNNKTKNIETLKRYFWRITSNFSLNDNNELLYKYYNNNDLKHEINNIYNKDIDQTNNYENTFR